MQKQIPDILFSYRTIKPDQNNVLILPVSRSRPCFYCNASHQLSHQLLFEKENGKYLPVHTWVFQFRPHRYNHHRRFRDIFRHMYFYLSFFLQK